MRNPIFHIILFLAVSAGVKAQSTKLIINPSIVLPKDSIEGRTLLNSLDSFLLSAQDNSENEWVLRTERIETQMLIDEIWDIRKSGEYKNDEFYKPYLTNLNPIENSKYAIQVAYIGMSDGVAIIRASFRLIAHKNKGSYTFSSPLVRNTQKWNTRRVDNHIFHFPYELDEVKIKEYCNLASLFDNKLNNNDHITHYYLGNDGDDPLALFGVDYKLDYNGRGYDNAWSTSIDRSNLIVLPASSFYDFDHHDLWHNRLSQVISRKEVHRRVDCHIACLYGGSWGFSWAELFPMFMDKFVVGTDVDWLAHKANSSHFKTNGRNNYTDDFLGALLVKKIEKEHGFEGVWKLLKTKRTKEETSYFLVLEELTGINRDNYNAEVTKLIEAEISLF